MRAHAFLRVLLLASGTAILSSSLPVLADAGTDRQALLDKGIAEKDRNEFDAAIADFSQAIALDPKWASPFEYRGASLAAKFEATEDPGQAVDLIAKAIADYDTVIKLGAATARTYTLRGIALSDREDYKSAIADFDRALAIDAKFALAVQAREFALGQQREQARAITLTSDLLRFQPRNIELLLTRAGLLAREGRRDDALRDLDKVLEIDPKNESAKEQRAALLAAAAEPASGRATTEPSAAKP